MAKPFKFDAIGRDLLAGERQAARAFVSKYESPPSRADAQKQMRTVMGRVLKATSQLSVSVTVKAVPTVLVGRRTKVVSGKRVQGAVSSTKVAGGMNEKKVQVGVKTRSTSQPVVRGSMKRSVKG